MKISKPISYAKKHIICTAIMLIVSLCHSQVVEAVPAPCASSSSGCPSIEWITIEGDTFNMGSKQTLFRMTLHAVTVPSFQIMKTEVTVSMYRACVNAKYCTAPACTASDSNCTYNSPATNNHPVNYVSWHDMMNFATWVGARLPTESEWEFIASSRGTSIYPWGNTEHPDCSRVNMSDCDKGPSTVCSRQSGNTTQGVCDMSGNVREWVQDEWHDDYIGAPIDGKGWCIGTCPDNSNSKSYKSNSDIQRVSRGSHHSDAFKFARAFIIRKANAPTHKSHEIGGRLARHVPRRSR